MSISMNGIYSTNPIMKARCNSQVINDGTTTRSGSFIAVSVSISAPHIYMGQVAEHGQRGCLCIAEHKLL